MQSISRQHSNRIIQPTQYQTVTFGKTHPLKQLCQSLQKGATGFADDLTKAARDRDPRLIFPTAAAIASMLVHQLPSTVPNVTQGMIYSGTVLGSYALGHAVYHRDRIRCQAQQIARGVKKQVTKWKKK